jgi:hypothetical protein
MTRSEWAYVLAVALVALVGYVLLTLAAGNGRPTP